MPRKKKIPAPSQTMSFAEYQGVVGVNWSSLKWLRVSPKHYEHHLRQPPEDRASLMAGRAFHTAVLEPDRFPIDYAVFTGPARRGEEWEAFKAANAGRTILKETEYAEALAIRDSVRAHKKASRILTGGLPEQVLVWTDPATKIVCKGRVDYLRPDGFVDLKRTTSRTFDLRRFGTVAHDYGYHLQAAFYRRGIASLSGVPTSDVRAWVVGVEGSAPFDVGLFPWDPEALGAADWELDQLLAKLAECRKRKKWPGRYEDETTLTLPAWAYQSEEADEAALGLNIGGAAA